MKYPLVVVSWNDAFETSDELRPEEIDHSPKVQHTTGWLIRRDKKGVTLATEYAEEDGRLRTTNFIPGGMVIRVKRAKL